ncbi:Homeobox protein homothorax [Eufriesea mexicana]|uniref:Homeobox protein homothorax n=1 Tax=Eufriesea mexicana TaxID=516756 RepID=A0A310SN87_9HYME|nr:Homeobox protein homothorax [Eufriesea mexicana]
MDGREIGEQKSRVVPFTETRDRHPSVSPVSSPITRPAVIARPAAFPASCTPPDPAFSLVYAERGQEGGRGPPERGWNMRCGQTDLFKGQTRHPRPPSSSLSYPGAGGNDDARSPGSGGTPGPLSQQAPASLDSSDPVTAASTEERTGRANPANHPVLTLRDRRVNFEEEKRESLADKAGIEAFRGERGAPMVNLPFAGGTILLVLRRSDGSRPGAIFHRDKAFSNDAGLALATAIGQNHAILAAGKPATSDLSP